MGDAPASSNGANNIRLPTGLISMPLPAAVAATASPAAASPTTEKTLLSMEEEDMSGDQISCRCQAMSLDLWETMGFLAGRIREGLGQKYFHGTKSSSSFLRHKCAFTTQGCFEGGQALVEREERICIHDPIREGVDAFKGIVRQGKRAFGATDSYLTCWKRGFGRKLTKQKGGL